MCKGLGDDVKQKVREGLETNRINAKTIDKTKQWLEGLIDKNNPNLTEEEVNEVFG